MELNYDYGFAANQYNGNIAGTQWRSRGDSERRAMGYKYDAANRIIKGDFAQYTSSMEYKCRIKFFSLTSMSYDPNGNIYTTWSEKLEDQWQRPDRQPLLYTYTLTATNY
jgi:hypothetical protein